MRLLVLLLAAVPALAQLPEFYKSVDRIVWVVDDVDRVVSAWKTTGLVSVRDNDIVRVAVRHRGAHVESRMRWAVVRLGDHVIDFIQPVEGADAYADFLKRHKPGVFALMHRVPSFDAYRAEIKRMEALGVKVLQSGADPDGGIQYTFFDTEPQGKYSLGLIWTAGPDAEGPLRPPDAVAGAARVTQYAFAIRDLGAVSKYWAALGWPEMTVTDPGGRDRLYRGKPGEFTMKLGWHRHGKVPYEWILSTKGPNVYEDHLAKHGEGFHHLAFNVPDMDKAIAEWVAWGFPVSQSGAWGEAGKRGSGRYAYHDLHAAGGIDIELLWNHRE